MQIPVQNTPPPPNQGPHSRSVSYIDLASQFAEEREELIPLIIRALEQGQWVGGPEVEALEPELKQWSGAGDVVTVGSGTDALILAMRALDIGPGDEVITPPNSFVSSTAAIVAVGATPVFADVLSDQLLDPESVAKVITPRCKAIMPVHLTGRIAEMNPILELARKHDLRVIEDAAQAFGARRDDRAAGTFGDVGCFSAHPLKNFNAMGDAGFVYCQNTEVANRIRRLRNNGLRDRNTVEEWGTVSRLDTVQAAVLRFRLHRVPSVVEARRTNARRYQSLLKKYVDPEKLFAPDCLPGQFNAFHTFVVQAERRDQLKQYLADQGIQTGIHYPVPIHLQPAAASLGYKLGDFPVVERQAERILSLPIHPYLTPEAIEEIVKTISEFYHAQC